MFHALIGRAPRRAWLAAIGALLLAGHGVAGQARADEDTVGVSNLVVSATPDGPVEEVFRAGVTDLEVRFDYEGATGEEVTVWIKGRGGIDVFASARSYEGDGVGRAAVTGDAMYPPLVDTLDTAAREAKRNAKAAAGSDVGLQEYLLSTQAAILRADHARSSLDGIGNLPDAEGRLVDEAEDYLARCMLRVERAIALPPDDPEGKQEEAQAIDELLGQVVLRAGQLEQAAEGLADLEIPVTGGGPQDAYVVQAHVEGDVAATTEVWVFSPSPIYLPYLHAGDAR